MNSAVAKLEESVASYVGRTVTVGPIYGWGWSSIQPESFQLRITELRRDADGNFRGGIGQIETTGHRYDRHWVAFSARHLGEWNFETQRGDFNVCIYLEQPKQCPSFVVDGSFVAASREAVTAGSAIIGNDA